MEKLMLSLVLLAGTFAHAELPLNPRDELTVRQYVTCTESDVTVHLMSRSGKDEMRHYRASNHRLERVDLLDVKTGQQLKLRIVPKNHGVFVTESSVDFEPTLATTEELTDEFQTFRTHCQMLDLIVANPLNTKLLDLAVILGTEREHAHFYWK